MDTVNQEPWGFVLTKTIREEDGVQVKHGFCMYPEERLGMHLNSASMMWERVEMLFQGVRSVMRDNGRARSGSFTMEWSASLHEFWKVTHSSNPIILLQNCESFCILCNLSYRRLHVQM